ncbi:protein-arginine deiminase type-2 isoform X2 [Gymnodraco acuticeps]|uniref:Protein-arginine deiminase n=1 Tax=Gymnodraco acuticeps TaxID=8218 RepID=A0A6P8TTD8_GYMAC|nr:protein-arginine deiminase type-2 isoform X1 [Gymnodraco acuticeps]XP_034061580.1 protein-arginine deiminase type-2 isoform X2 [Gymnodraco acuticeps]
MMHPRTFRVDYDHVTSVVCVVGSGLNVNLNRSAPPGSEFFSVKSTATVQYSISPQPRETSHLSPIPLKGTSALLIRMSRASDYENDGKLSIRYYGEKKDVLGSVLLHLTAVEISLDVDADRDGVVEKNNANKGSWKWGSNGHGAILLVNCDSERMFLKKLDSEQDQVSKVSDLKDMSVMVLRTKGPAKLPKGYKLTMHISQGDAESVRVFRARSSGVESNLLQKLFSHFVKEYPLVLSNEVLSQEVPYLGGISEMKFYVEGLRFPDKDFDGLISINLSLLEPISDGLPETPIFTDTAVFRVAPWIMTPNTLQPVEVFVCSTSDNYQFLKGMRNLITKSGYKLKICHEYMNRGDRWMQDELEFGYIDSPHHRFPVVLDSPRDRGLKDFPYDELLGPDFGYVTRVAQREDVSSLDSFGNLEVSPPVTVNGKNYPLGRILIGVAFPTATKGRNMTKVVQDFLWAQKVQEPVALFSDWLVVGHIDEFMSFVPAPDRKGFRLLLASPDAGYKLFRGLQRDGHGQAKLFEGLKDEEQQTVDEILNDKGLAAENNYVQSCIDWNRDVLKRELGLDDEDIIDLPILFKLLMEENDNNKAETELRAVAYYPDMVNMIVLGKNLGIPKPFGPKVNGRCALEVEMCSLMEGLGLSCTFIDDFASYHKKLGEVHCGSNVRREPFDFKWWNLEM